MFGAAPTSLAEEIVIVVAAAAVVGAVGVMGVVGVVVIIILRETSSCWCLFGSTVDQCGFSGATGQPVS
jgi:hypothetical protein